MYTDSLLQYSAKKKCFTLNLVHYLYHCEQCFFFFSRFFTCIYFYSFSFLISSKVLHDSKIIQKLSFCKSSSRRFLFLSQKEYRVIIYPIFVTFENSMNYINVQYIVIEWSTKTFWFLLYGFIYFHSYSNDESWTFRKSFQNFEFSHNKILSFIGKNKV